MPMKQNSILFASTQLKNELEIKQGNKNRNTTRNTVGKAKVT